MPTEPGIPDDDRKVTTPPTISVRCFGTFQLTINGRSVERWRAGKARNLLQFLLMRRDRAVPRYVLYDALWPDRDWNGNSSSLKVAVHMLRNVLATQDERPHGQDRPSSLRLLTRESGYQLEADGVWIDFEVFDALIDLAQGARERGETQAATAWYRRAVDLYHGDFLSHETMAWADLQREWLRNRVLSALDWLTGVELARGSDVAAIGWCHRTLEIEPLREATYRTLMRVYAEQGQVAQVHRWHELCASRLRVGLQVEPDETTERLYARAIRGELGDRPRGHG